MAIVKPFKALRPAASKVADVAALPYDVYSSDEARAFVVDKPYSFLRIDRPETYFDKTVDSYSHDVYQKAKEMLYQWFEEGVLIQDPSECFYLYELTMDGRSQTGIVAATSIDDYLENRIKKHEKTRADKEADRINHVDYCDANTGPIFLTYRSKKSVDLLVASIKEKDVLYSFVADDGVLHRCWLIDQADIIDQIINEFASVDSLYIADGHHRAASAVAVGLKRREAHPNYTGKESFNYFLSVIFPDDQLYIMDYNRVVKDLNGLSHSEFLRALEQQFKILDESKDVIKPTIKGTFSMYLENRWYLLEAKPGTFDIEDPVLSLDVSILQLNVLSPILGVGDPRTDKRIDFIGGIRGLKEIERRCESDMMVGFAMVATSIEELIQIADAQQLMPPKSTWFEPKLRSGIFIHVLGK